MPWRLALATADNCDDLLAAGWEPFQVNYIPESAITNLASDSDLLTRINPSSKLVPLIALRLWVKDELPTFSHASFTRN